MEQPDVDLARLRDLHKQRRELTSFYQVLVTALHPAPLQAWSTFTLLVSLMALMLGTGLFSPSQKLAVIQGAVIAAVAMATWITALARRDARSIRDRYVDEHELLFPGHEPIGLVSFLLPDRRTAKIKRGHG